jgi:hypothetical protein
MRHPFETEVVTALVIGSRNGDYICDLLIKEYDEIADNEQLRYTFVETIANERSSVAYKKWLLKHKDLFYDDRFYTI